MKSMEDQAKNDDQHGNDGKKFHMGQKGSRKKNKNGKKAVGWFSKITVLISNKRCLKKMQFKTHPWNGEKCKRLPKGRLRNRENVECIDMYRNVSDKKNGVIHV